MATTVIDVQAAANLLKRSARHVQKLCVDGRIKGARMVGGTWVIVAEVDRKGKIIVEVTPQANGPNAGQ